MCVHAVLLGPWNDSFDIRTRNQIYRNIGPRSGPCRTFDATSVIIVPLKIRLIRHHQNDNIVRWEKAALLDRNLWHHEVTRHDGCCFDRLYLNQLNLINRSRDRWIPAYSIDHLQKLPLKSFHILYIQ